MSEMGFVAMFAVIFGQWTNAAGAFWLTWWAAQSRDSLALRIAAVLLVVVPALLWPVWSLWMTWHAQEAYQSAASMALAFGIAAAVLAVLRAIVLIVWAIVSKDRTYLRTGGIVVALLELAGPAVQLLGTLAQWRG